jgi:hypothetical protein
MTGADLHPNAIDGTTGTELTAASQTTYDSRWLRKTGGTLTPATNSTSTFQVTKQDGTTTVLGVDTTKSTPRTPRSTLRTTLPARHSDFATPPASIPSS